MIETPTNSHRHSPEIVFRVDASPAIGGGHVMRCLALAQTLRNRGFTCAFAVRKETLKTVAALSESTFPVLELGMSPQDEAAFLRHSFPHGCDTLAVDHYGLNHDFESACRPWANRILAIDDLADRRHDCDVLVDPNPGRTAADYRGLAPENTILLIGTAYTILRNTFWSRRWKAIQRRSRRKSARRIFIGYGLTDPTNLTVAALDAIAQVKPGAEVDVAIGSAAPGLTAVRHEAERLPLDVRLHVDCSDVAFLIARADCGFGAAGSSSWERCCLGLPSIASVVAENQRLIGNMLHAHGAGLVCDEASQLAATAERMLSDDALRHSMSQSAATLCDGLGAARVAQSLFPAVSGRETAVRLRPATDEDTETVFQWQTIPGIRRYFINPDPPSRNTHIAWMAERLKSPDCIFNIILCDDRPAGFLRLDRQTPRHLADGIELEVSILIAPDQQAKGVGTAALRLGRDLVPEATLIARIHDDNHASRKTFERAGFERRPDGLFMMRPTEGDQE